MKKGNGRKRSNDLQKSLEADKAAKEAELKRLQEENRVLQHQYKLLVTLCDMLAWIRHQEPGATCEAADETEHQLLQQLHSLPVHPVSCGGTCCSHPRTSATTSSSTDVSLHNNTQQPTQQQATAAAAGDDSKQQELGPAGAFIAPNLEQEQQQQQQQASDTTADTPAEVTNAAAQAQQPEQTIASPDNMLFLFQQLVAAPIDQDMLDSYTLQQLQQEYICTLRDLALHLQLHKAHMAVGVCMHRLYSTCQQQQEGREAQQQLTPLQKIEALMFRHFQILVALILGGYPCLATAFHLSNCETGIVIPQGSPQHHLGSVSLIGLSQQQQKAIATGWPVFKRLLQPVLDEQRELQLKMQALSISDQIPPSTDVSEGGTVATVATDSDQSTSKTKGTADSAQTWAGGYASAGRCNSRLDTHAAAEAEPLPLTAADAAAAASVLNGLSNGATAVGQPEARTAAAPPPPTTTTADGDAWCIPKPFIHGKQLDVQERHASRLKACLHKDCLIKAFMGCYLWGCMTWEQVANLHVLMCPYPPLPAMTYKAVIELLQQQQ